MEVIVGTYEQLILGYKCDLEDKSTSFDVSFTDHSHIGIVRTVEVSSNFILASGSTDESIKLFNLKKRREVGTLVHHSGSINQIAFYGRDHMFTCSDDGTIAIWRTGRWECIKTLRGHKGAIYAMAIHPSGKMALSVSKDQTMRTWNLLTGKCAYVTNIKQVADFIQWAPSGDRYFIVTNMSADMYNVETASVEKTIKCGFKIHSIVFIEDDVAAVGGDGGIVQFYGIPGASKLFEFETQTVRIKDMKFCRVEQQDLQLLITGSSDGLVKVWQLTRTKNDWQCALFKSVDTKFRILSIACLLLSSAEDDSTTDVSGIPTEPVCDSDNSDDVMHNDSSSEDSEVASDSDEREIVIKNPVNKAVKGANNPEAAAHLNKSQTKKTQRQLEKKRAKRKAYIASKKRKIEAAKGSLSNNSSPVGKTEADNNNTTAKRKKSPSKTQNQQRLETKKAKNPAANLPKTLKKQKSKGTISGTTQVGKTNGVRKSSNLKHSKKVSRKQN